MAAATARDTSSIDLRSQASYPVRLGQSLLKASDAKKFTSVQYNHKPVFKTPKDAKYSLKSVSDSVEEVLEIRDGDDLYKYSGRATVGHDMYALVSKGSGKGVELVLERLRAGHEFNLTRTPSESDEGRLAAQFPQLTFHDAEGLFGDDEDDEEPVDKSNPWDYRNHLKRTATGVKQRERKPLTSNPMQARAATSTPIARPTKQSSGPLVAQKKRKAQGVTKADPKRVKAGTEPPQAPVPGSRSQPVPQVRIDRKASMRRPSLDDSGELILENETPITEKPPRRVGAMALALGGQLAQGPISLRSAASSPASMAASPMASRPEGMDEGEEFTFGSDSSPEAASKPQLKQRREDDYFDGGDDDEGSNADADVDADADADVEDLELPSPAQTHQKNINTATLTAATDDDDDLDKQLALAMAEDEDGGEPPALAESDEESEEE